MDGGDGCTCEYANAIELHLKMVNMVNFMYILPHKKTFWSFLNIYSIL